MSQSRATKTQYAPSLPNLMHPIFARIEQLHQKNKQIALKSDNKNKEIVQTHIYNKHQYQNTVMKIHNRKVANVHQSLQQRKKARMKMNDNSMNKAHQNLLNIQTRHQTKIGKHMQNLSLKLERAEQNRKKFTLLRAMQKLKTSSVTPTNGFNSQQNGSMNTSLMNSTGVSMQRKVMAELRREELKRKQLQKSRQLLNQSVIKQQQAIKRRNSLRNIRRTQILQQKINEAKQHAKKMQLDKQNSNISKAISKYSKFKHRVSQVILREDNNSAEKKEKKFQKTGYCSKQKVRYRIKNEQKKQQLLQRKFAKIENISQKKQEMLQTFCQNLHSKVLQRKQKLQQKVQKMKKCERQHAMDQLKKQKQSMLFLTSLKAQKDRIISRNMYETVQLRHFR